MRAPFWRRPPFPSTPPASWAPCRAASLFSRGRICSLRPRSGCWRWATRWRAVMTPRLSSRPWPGPCGGPAPETAGPSGRPCPNALRLTAVNRTDTMCCPSRTRFQDASSVWRHGRRTVCTGAGRDLYPGPPAPVGRVHGAHGPAGAGARALRAHRGGGRGGPGALPAERLGRGRPPGRLLVARFGAAALPELPARGSLAHPLQRPRLAPALSGDDPHRPAVEQGRCAVFVGSAHMLNLRRMLAEEGFRVRRCR